MTTQTPNYNLTLYDNIAPDINATFQTYRTDQSGVVSTSNMNLIDTALHNHDVEIGNIVNGFTYIYAGATGTNTYEKTAINSISSYNTGVGILLSVDTPNSGSSTLNINSLGVRTLKKLNTSGSTISLVGGDLLLGVIYPFIYYSGDVWVLLSGSGGGTSGSGAGVFTTGSVADGHLAIFDGTSGSFIRDGGVPGGAPVDADYWVETANGGLSAEVVVGTTGITTGAYASKQAAAKAGRLFLPSDGYALERDTGTGWSAWGPLFPLVTPDLTNYAWVNQGGASLTTTQGGVYMSDPANAGVSLRMYVKSIPNAALYNLVVGVIPNIPPAQYGMVGLCVRDSAISKLIQFSLQFRTSQPKFSVAGMTNETTWSTDYANTLVHQEVSPMIYLSISDNGTTRYYKYSYDGAHWQTVWSHARATFCTPNQYGIICASYNSNIETGGLYLHKAES